MMEQKRVWLYCRVAHSDSNSADLLERERYRLEGYAREYGFEIAGSSSDIGSGLTLDRPGLLAFLNAVDAETVDVLLLADLARLGRDMNKVIQYWQMLRGHGISIYTSIDGEVDLSINALLQAVAGK